MEIKQYIKENEARFMEELFRAQRKFLVGKF